jgi:hypothetical protein
MKSHKLANNNRAHRKDKWDSDDDFTPAPVEVQTPEPAAVVNDDMELVDMNRDEEVSSVILGMIGFVKWSHHSSPFN